MTQRTVDLLGIVPMLAIFTSQALGSDAAWLVTNLLFLCYNLFILKLWSQTACSVVLIAICLTRLYRSRR